MFTVRVYLKAVWFRFSLSPIWCDAVMWCCVRGWIIQGVSHDSRQFSLERPKRPDKNLQSLSRATQLTKEELKHFYRAFKQVRAAPLQSQQNGYFLFLMLLLTYVRFKPSIALSVWLISLTWLTCGYLNEMSLPESTPVRHDALHA